MVMWICLIGNYGKCSYDYYVIMGSVVLTNKYLWLLQLLSTANHGYDNYDQQVVMVIGNNVDRSDEQ